METLIAVALVAATLGANAETQERREQIRAFIEQVNPRFPYADEAANQLLYAQSKNGADAKLVAALVAQERRWLLKKNGIYEAPNLGQILHSTGRRCFGRAEAPDWQTNLLWTSWYLQGCLQANDFNVTDALREYNGGPAFRSKPVTKRYARAVLYYHNRIGGK